MPSLLERLCDRSIREDRGYVTPCRIYKGSLCSGGYGSIGANRRTNRAHVVVWELIHGPAAPGEHVHHRCGQRDCHEPLHLIALSVTKHRGEHLRTHCPHGHAYDEANTYVGTQKDGRYLSRKCRTCRRDDMRARHQQKRATA